MPSLRMVHLLTVGSAFQARVLAARLGSEGIVTSLRGAVDGPYPLGDVGVFVDADDMDLARQLLLADEVEAVFNEARPSDRRRGAPALLLAIIVLTVAGSMARIAYLAL